MNSNPPRQVVFLADPIFGVALALMAGQIALLLISRIAVVLFFGL